MAGAARRANPTHGDPSRGVGGRPHCLGSSRRRGLILAMVSGSNQGCHALGRLRCGLGAAGGRSCSLGVSRESPRECIPVNLILGQKMTACAYVVGELSELPCGTHEF